MHKRSGAGRHNSGRQPGSQGASPSCRYHRADLPGGWQLRHLLRNGRGSVGRRCSGRQRIPEEREAACGTYFSPMAMPLLVLSVNPVLLFGLSRPTICVCPSQAEHAEPCGYGCAVPLSHRSAAQCSPTRPSTA
ncbi:hypothetical protein AAFF_G00415360 [Aldrovandia affinis]|uniref:Uncharacterized protein n=1 Tax=Aldrovandia affinis TaxID=143900 RepID=A0AAD7SB97_9TELE|nr:hypothetical protein AAFF_G00415360 [Aldrovandia affinis]